MKFKIGHARANDCVAALGVNTKDAIEPGQADHESA